jgi:ribonuclease E
MPNESDPDSHPATLPGSGEVRAKRRRGNRGGKGRNKQNTAQREGVKTEGQPHLADQPDLSDQPDLPDLPWEGQPTSGSGEIGALDVGRRPRRANQQPRTPQARTPQARTPQTSPQQTSPQKLKQPQKLPPVQSTVAESEATDLARDLHGDSPVSDLLANELVSNEGAKPVERKASGGRSGETKSSGRNRGRRPGSRDGRGRARQSIKSEYTMCVHVQPHVTQIAVLEGRSLIEHYVSHAEDDASQIHGNIYLGRVQNVLPGMEAAFVDIATPKNAVLYRGDVQFDRTDLDAPQDGKEVRIEQLLKNGQLVTCQVTKNPIGSKGARLTQEVSIAGRFVVLVPNSSTFGISKRLPDDERRRLRGVLDEVKPADHGIIVRTAASGADAVELRRDVQMLVAEWDRISSKAAKLRGPALLHREPNLAVRIIREEFSENYQQVVIDDREVFDEVRRYVETITPELADRIVYFDPAEQALPVFEQFHVHEQLHKAIDRKVWLPSGGSIIIERTEALTVIDVNTGKNVGSTSLEETVFRNNLEAATEIARQLRLRDIGGIIVIDFIDMEIKPNRAEVVAHFRDELARDKTRTQVFEISDLGLVEMTRKRISEGLIEALSDVCPTCHGRGFVFDPGILAE